MKKVLLIVGVVVLVAIGAAAIVSTLMRTPSTSNTTTNTNSNTNTQTNSANTGGPIPGGPTGGLAVRPTLDDLLVVNYPTANAVVESPLTIDGQARGNFYFEAVFPVKLLDANGTVIAQGQAQAQGSWMTTDYVPFTATLTFTKPATDTGTLVLKNDNPSGDPSKDKELDIPVRFVSNGQVNNK